jgi:putative transposase
MRLRQTEGFMSSVLDRVMKRFKSARQLQRFVSIHDPIANLFHFPRNNFSSAEHRDLRSTAMAAWNEIAHAMLA